MDDAFLTHMASEDSTASLIVLLPDNSVSQIKNVSPFAVLDKCPLLYHSFEFGANSIRQANIKATSTSAVLSLLRYLYSGDYVTESEPDSLFKHAEAFKIAQDYNVPELEAAAYLKFSEATEYACSTTTPPPGLCDTVRFLYKHLASSESRQEQSIIDILLHYCLVIFDYQGLAKNPDFRQVIFDLPAFHKDLCRQSMQRNFQDVGASDLVRLPASYETSHSMDSLHKNALGDFQYELMQDIAGPLNYEVEVETNSTKRRQDNSDHLTGPMLTLRLKDLAKITEPTNNEGESDLSSDEGGFTLVCRPKCDTTTVAAFDTSDSVPSSPEMMSLPSPRNEFSVDSSIEDDRNLAIEDGWSLV
ncbi:hypothetical protein P280DRAFT_181301 [Massarina eburnea CBS 473.64]|uniref:BTB domain-containing protein n=1 Tax=Massarina eburnea CBS 473.64 TaxID=1395130 RepID=A0A6A6SAN1_9PLEO|nr:hypothetical protein P280DRAFT_181301 [Massarina eburnea CBS 473.64]